MFDDITYFDGEYYEGKYHTVIKPNSVELLGDYIEEGYITDDYFQEEPPAVFSLEASPISYQSRFNSNNLRPFDIEFDSLATFDSTIKKYGTHSLELGFGGYAISEFINQDDFSFPPTAFEINADSSFCFEGWFYIEAHPNDMVVNIEPLLWAIGLGGIDDMDELSSSSNLCIAVGVDPGTGTNFSTYAPVAVVNSQSGFTRMVGSYTMAPDTWYHIALTRDTSGNLDLRINDSSSATATNSGRIVNSITERLKFANNFNTALFNDPDKVYVDSFIASYNDDTVRGYSSAPNGGLNDIVHYRFDNNLNDDTSVFFNVNETYSTNASLSATALATVGTITTISAAASLSVDAQALKDASSSLSSSASLTATGTNLQSASSTLSSSAIISITGSKRVTTSSSVSSSADIDIDYNRIRNFDTEFDVIGSTVIAAGKVGEFFVNADITASLTADGIIKVDGAAILNSAFDTQTDANRTRSTSSSVSASATIAETSTRLRRSSSSLTAATSLITETRSIRETSVAMSAAHSLSTIIGKTTGSVVDLESAFDISMLGGSLTPSSASINATFTQITNGFIINLAQYVYYIPVESRLNTISSETRSHSVRPETRAHSVDIETRSQTIRTEDRIHEVKGT